MLRKADCGMPSFTDRLRFVERSADDQNRVFARVDAMSEIRKPLGIGGRATADRSNYSLALRLFIPVVQRDRQEHRALRRLKCDSIRTHEGSRNILGPFWLVAPLHPGPGHPRGVHIGKPRLQQEHLPGLLASRYDQRRLVLERSRQVCHQVPHAGSRVHVH